MLGIGLRLGKTPHNLFMQSSSPTLDISAMTYNSVNYDYAGESARLREIAVKDDGTVIMAVSQSNDKLFQYNCDGWDDLSNLTKDAFEITMATLGDGEINPQGLAMKPDGTKLYYHGTGNDTIYQRPLSTPWDLSTIGSTEKSLLLTTNCIWFTLTSNGEHLYYIDASISTDTVRQYDLGTAWDISTATDSGNTFEFTSLGAGPMWISPDGTKLVMAALAPDDLRQYSFGTAFDISTLTYDDKVLAYDTETTDTHCSGLVIKPDDFSKIWMAGGTTKFIYELS